MADIIVAGNTSGAITISAPLVAGSGTLTLPVATDTLVGKATTDTLTNKTLTTPTISSLSSASATNLTLQSAGTTAITVDTSQNVGIGTTSPATKLNVQGFASYRGDAYTISSFSANSTLAPLNITQMNDGTIPSISAGQNSTGTWASLGFMTSGTERARIDSSGNVLVGCITIPSASVAGVSLQATRLISVGINTTANTYVQQFYNPNGLIGSITLSASTTSYNTSSDYRLKENIAPMTGALDKIAQLKPVTYKWKSDGSEGEGFIAHELQAVVPDCVTGEKDAVDEEGNIKAQGIDTSFLVATLTAAIQELKAIVDTQAERIKALENKP